MYGVKDFHFRGHPGYTHDHNITVMKNGKILTYLHLERLTRLKYDNNLDSHIDNICDQLKLGIKIEECDWVFVDSFAGRSFISSSGRIRFEAPLHSDPLKFEVTKGNIWFKSHENYVKGNGYAISQEVAHISSCLPFFGNFKDDSLIIHFDGGASLSNFSAWEKSKGKVKLIEYHWKLEKIAAMFHGNPLAFNLVNCKQEELSSLAGKLMGFATVQELDKEIHNWLIENDFFFKDDTISSMFRRKAKERYGWKGDSFDTKDLFLQKVAAGFQAEFEQRAYKKINDLQRKHKFSYLYMSGGCALNILLNNKLVTANIFKEVFIPPCCNDSGLSIGAAAFIENLKGHKLRTHDAYLNNFSLSRKVVKPKEDLIKKISKLIADGEIIGVANESGECGPRALGNRSIIGRPDSIELKKKLSESVKQREWYRPIAPIMLLENTKKVTGLKKIDKLSGFMLLDYVIKKEYYERLKGVIHFNGTSRIQTLFSRKDNPFMHQLLVRLQQDHDILAIMNTSFNGRNEPIVHTAEDALNAARKMHLKYLILNGELKELI